MIGQIVPPDQCDENGDPLDWERCRTCEGRKVLTSAGPGGQALHPCPTCGGHGSLEAAALAMFSLALHSNARKFHEPGPEGASGWKVGMPEWRCEDCNHPMSEGTWEGEGHPNDASPGLSLKIGLQKAETLLRRGEEPRWPRVHFSPCDEKCNHGGPGQANGGAAHWDANRTAAQMLQRTGILTVEASWRPVAVRTGIPAPPGHPHPMLYTRPFDLRLENLRVLCLRCWAARA